jgi:hypothetical protein
MGPPVRNSIHEMLGRRANPNGYGSFRTSGPKNGSQCCGCLNGIMAKGSGQHPRLDRLSTGETISVVFQGLLGSCSSEAGHRKGVSGLVSLLRSRCGRFHRLGE